MENSKVNIQRQTKRFIELTVTNFEYDGENYTVIYGNIAINDNTKITQRFHNETLVTELQIKIAKPKTLTLQSARDLKNIERSQITNINGIEFDEIYPSLTISNKNASYYSIKYQGNISLQFPVKVIVK